MDLASLVTVGDTVVVVSADAGVSSPNWTSAYALLTSNTVAPTNMVSTVTNEIILKIEVEIENFGIQ